MTFQKGQSGNPGGRQRTNGEVRELARSYTVDAIKALARVMRAKKSPPAAVVAAATVLLDRGWGKPVQQIEATIDTLDRVGHEDRLLIEAALVALAGSEDDALAGGEAEEHRGGEGETVLFDVSRKRASEA